MVGRLHELKKEVELFQANKKILYLLMDSKSQMLLSYTMDAFTIWINMEHFYVYRQSSCFYLQASIVSC